MKAIAQQILKIFAKLILKIHKTKKTYNNKIYNLIIT